MRTEFEAKMVSIERVYEYSYLGPEQGLLSVGEKKWNNVVSSDGGVGGKYGWNSAQKNRNSGQNNIDTILPIWESSKAICSEMFTKKNSLVPPPPIPNF